ncbi:MAG: methionyl-tRNA formyltransferase [Ignavibacteria bacterium]
MRIIFMGTPAFAVSSLSAIQAAGHNIIYVVTVPDKSQGRGLISQPSSVKQYALGHNIPILQPDNLKNPEFLKTITEANADLIVVVAFKVLPPEVYNKPRYGAINLHASLLPKYRGAAPINWALINGEIETGVTIFFLKEKVDTGDILLQKKLVIDKEDDFGSLYYKLANLGAKTLVDALEIIERGSYSLIQQNDSEATPAPKITKDLCKIEWTKSSFEIHNLVRGLSPTPGAFTYLNGKLIKIFKTKPTDENADFNLAGRLLIIKSRLFVHTSDKLLEILSLQSEGRKKMTAAEFINGLKERKGLQFRNIM